MAEQFSRRQVELILRRTAELERRSDESLDTITPADLEKVAAELGLSQDALRQAIAEARAGLLDRDEASGFVDRVFGARWIEARRYVPGAVDSVQAAIERFLDAQGFQLKRHKGDVTVWEAARDFWTRMRRAFRAGPYRLPRDVEIEVRVAAMPNGPRPVVVRLRVDASRLRGSRVNGAALGVGAGVAVAVAGAVLLPMPVELATWLAGGAAGVAGALGSRASYRTARERLQTALERFLDFLEHTPPPARPSAAQDPIARLVEFLSGDWWR